MYNAADPDIMLKPQFVGECCGGTRLWGMGGDTACPAFDGQEACRVYVCYACGGVLETGKERTARKKDEAETLMSAAAAAQAEAHAARRARSPPPSFDLGGAEAPEYGTD